MVPPAITLSRIVFTVGGGNLEVVPRQGTPEQLTMFRDLAGPVGPFARDAAFQASPVTDERQGAQRYVAARLCRIYQMTAGVAFAAGLIAVGYSVIRRQGFPLPLLAMIAACLAAAICQIALLAYLEATSIPSANSLYASPVSPFVISGAVLGCYAVVWTLRRRRETPALHKMDGAGDRLDNQHS